MKEDNEVEIVVADDDDIYGAGFKNPFNF